QLRHHLEGDAAAHLEARLPLHVLTEEHKNEIVAVVCGSPRLRVGGLVLSPRCSAKRRRQHRRSENGCRGPGPRMRGADARVGRRPRAERSADACPQVDWVQVSAGGPAPKDPQTLALRWIGYSNFELAYNGQIFLLD